MLKLYGGARSRAAIVQWYLEEIVVPYEFVLLDIQSGENLEPDFIAINPIGKVPAIVDGDFKLWESGAILLYLAEKYGKLPEDLSARSQVTQWIMFANATLIPGLFNETSRDREQRRLLNPLNHIFEQHPFVIGEEFTIADVAIGSTLAYLPIVLKLDLSPYPAALNYVQRISERPAFQKTIGARFSNPRLHARADARA